MSESTPICRCRVLYLGSSVPHQTKDGLQGIQEPLQELYPDQGATGAKGIDSWLSVWSNGILLENVDENHKKITRFFPIESLHYCAAVRYVLVPEKNTLHAPSPKFLPLDSPFARTPNPTHPPLFAAILRRTTGIKVLECHAFICKREVAANALVRCCFHAYADSSYAKQVDTAGSIYGTLVSDRLDNKNKIDAWQLNRIKSGSSMTINTIGNGKDDVSIYNGDENHKVWAGSQDNLDGIYDIYSPSTLSRPSRPRQISQPVSVVPPPPSKDRKKKIRGQSKSLAGSREDLYNALTNGKASSISGTLIKAAATPTTIPTPIRHGSVPKQMQIPMQMQMQPQPMYIVGPPPPPAPPTANVAHYQGTLPNPKFFKHYGNTFSHRPRGKMLIPARPIPPPMVPLGPVLIPAPTTLTKNKKKQKPIAMEEPIYMPSNRALSPVASYQPVTFPHEAYLMQQYATMDNHGKQQRKSREKSVDKSGKLNKKLAQSMNNLDDPNLLREDNESPFNTGIYRQEHRSRSYGSLANLKFATPLPNGVHDDIDREDIKKEREIIQMVQDLDLSGDEIERSEVPRGMYDPRNTMAPGPVILTGTQLNGRGHRR